MTIGMRVALFALPLSLIQDVSGPSAPTRLAAPEVIVMHGGPLTRRVVLGDYDENHRLMLATTERATLSVDLLRQRPRIGATMYWGTQWRGRKDLPDSVGLVVTMDGAQAGAFYPAFHGKPAIWVFGAYGTVPASARRISADGLAILAKHNIPTTVEASRPAIPGHGS